jgi:myo-inositol-1(or 4)-monophosphatase
MLTPSFSSFMATALEVADEIALRHYGQVDRQVTKGADNNQVLTAADLEIGQALINMVMKAYPGHNIIDEEAGVIDRGSEFTWTIDPIDGTSNFANGTPTFGTMFGLLYGDRPIAGGLSLPALGDQYLAEAGQGAFKNGQRIQVTHQPELLQCLFSYGVDGHQENPLQTYQEAAVIGELILRIRNLRTTNSAYDIAMVAQGSFAGMLNRTGKIWDNVAQHVLIEEAGGVYTTYDGQPMDYSQPLTKAQLNYTYCAVAPQFVAEIQAIVKSQVHEI